MRPKRSGAGLGRSSSHSRVLDVFGLFLVRQRVGRPKPDSCRPTVPRGAGSAQESVSPCSWLCRESCCGHRASQGRRRWQLRREGVPGGGGGCLHAVNSTVPPLTLCAPRAYAQRSMLRWFRVHASRVAVAAIISLAAVGISAVSPHVDDCHDAGCRAMAVNHDASAHAIGASSTSTDAYPLHCLVCHWARSFQPRPEARIVSAKAADAGTAVHVDLFTAASAALAAQPPARSPPSSPVEA